MDERQHRIDCDAGEPVSLVNASRTAIRQISQGAIVLRTLFPRFAALSLFSAALTASPLQGQADRTALAPQWPVRQSGGQPEPGTGVESTVVALPFDPLPRRVSVDSFPAPIGVDRPKWIRLGRKAQRIIYLLANKMTVNTGTAAKNPSVQENMAIVANKLIAALDAGRAAGALMPGMPPGSEANEAGALAYAGCEMFRWMRGPETIFLSQDAVAGARDLVQGVAEAHTEFPGYDSRTNMVKQGLRGVLEGSRFEPADYSCADILFLNKSPDDFRLDDGLTRGHFSPPASFPGR
jgi:hypothetical protein